PGTRPRGPPALEALAAPAAEGRPRPVVFDAVPGRPGEYRAFLSHDAPGRFELKLTKPEAGSLAYRVGLPPRHELEPSALAEGPLRELAAVSGGRFYREEDLHTLAES